MLLVVEVEDEEARLVGRKSGAKVFPLLVSLTLKIQSLVWKRTVLSTTMTS